MDKQGWIAQLGRLYKEAKSSEGSSQGSSGLAEQFNRVLSKLQEEFPDEDFVQDMDGVDSPGGNDLFGQADAVKEVKMKCGQLADALGYNLPESELEEVGDITVLSMRSDQTQTADQTVTQNVSIENVMEMINYTTLNQQKQAELQEVVSDFEEELSKDNPDTSTLRDYIESAKGYSVDVSAKMSMIALSHGLVDILNF